MEVMEVGADLSRASTKDRESATRSNLRWTEGLPSESKRAEAFGRVAGHRPALRFFETVSAAQPYRGAFTPARLQVTCARG